MIISCPNCNKKFSISETLIPKDGRLLQCSNCNHRWYFQIPVEPEDNSEAIKLIDTQEETKYENISPENIKNEQMIFFSVKVSLRHAQNT